MFQQFTEQNMNDVPRYSLIVRDTENTVAFAQKTMCCFVVPLGCEREMDILNPDKQIALLEQIGTTRVVIVVLGRGHQYENLD